MKHCLFILLCAISLSVKAQNIKKVDTAYYFIDTLHTTVKDRMWDIGIDENVKYFTIKCPCLQYGQFLTFIYKKDLPGKVIEKNYFDKLHITDLATLIKIAKQFAEGKESDYTTIIFISKEYGEYKMYKMNVLQAKKPDVMY